MREQCTLIVSGLIRFRGTGYALACFVGWVCFAWSDHRMVADIIATVCIGEQLRNSLRDVLAK